MTFKDEEYESAEGELSEIGNMHDEVCKTCTYRIATQNTMVDGVETTGTTERFSKQMVRNMMNIGSVDTELRMQRLNFSSRISRKIDRQHTTHCGTFRAIQFRFS